MTATPSTPSADLFCRVIDNYGDIGVCLRLARQLTRHHGWRIRLWLDAPEALAKLEPTAAFQDGVGQLDGIELVHWSQTPPALAPLDICIEAFACDPPADYLAQLDPQRHLWLNLEYLSAEDWVAGCHLLPSLQANGVPKYFFFPGFLPGTGGLLREPGLLAARDSWQADRTQAAGLLQSLGLAAEALAHWQTPGSRLINLFCYPHAPLAALTQALAQSPRPTLLLVPEGVAPSLAAGRTGNLHIARHAFVRQEAFDRLLWSADLNLIRGEDSLVRAIWAGRPLLWHIYPQTDDAHLEKLQAWLGCSSLTPAVQAAFAGWNRAASSSTVPAGPSPASSQTAISWPALLDGPAWQDWQKQARHDSDQLARQADLGQQLVSFCLEKLAAR